MKNLILAAIAALSLTAIAPAANAKSTVAGDTNGTVFQQTGGYAGGGS